MPHSFSRSIQWDIQIESYQVVEQAEGRITSSRLNFQGQQWQEWLQQVQSFAFLSKDGHRFTARKEKRARGATYWIAYRKIDGKLTHKYLGRPADVTLMRLEEVAAALAEQEMRADLPGAITDHQEHLVHGELVDQLLSTKFFVPVSSHVLISRPRLSTLLDEGQHCSLTVISAPAGFGKTTLLSSWVQTLSKEAVLVAWVSLDEQDNDLARFWMYVFTALDRLQPGMCSDLVAYLRTQQTPPIQYLLTALINRLAENPQRQLLVLDDFHLVTEQTIYTSLTFLLEHLPPQLRIILASRSDPPLPLARLRARSQLLEVRAEQLRTTDEEAAFFLREVMGVQLSDRELALVQQHTENWLVGLQLVGLSLQGSSPTINRGILPGGQITKRDLLSEISGHHEFILDYLTDEVLYRQPPAIQTFLLSTSILEQLSAPFCDAVLEQQGSQQVLEGLERSNLFLTPLDRHRRWYRYHGLFAEALRYRLEQEGQEKVHALHLRASQWYALQGQTYEAVQHALQAHAWEFAADLIEPIMGAFSSARGELITLHRWMEQLPAEVAHFRPRLCIDYARVLNADVSTQEAEAWLQAAEKRVVALLETAGSENVNSELYTQSDLNMLLADILALRALHAAHHGDGKSGLSFSQQSLTHPSEQDLVLRSHIVIAQSMAYTSSGDVVPAIQLALEAGALAQAVGVWTATTCLIAAASNFLYQGRLHAAWNLLERVTEMCRPRSSDLVLSLGLLSAYQADILREWNQLDAAYDLARKAVRLSEESGHLISLHITYAILAGVTLSRGESDAAVSAITQAEGIMVQLNNSYYRALLIAVEHVRIWIARGELAQAARWAEELRQQERQVALLAREREDVALARVLLAQNKLDETVVLLLPLIENATRQERWGHVIEMLLLQALALYRNHKEQEAFSALRHVVHLAEPESYIRRFVDEGLPMFALLSAFQKQERKQGPTPYLDSLLAAFAQEGTGVQSRQSPLPLRISPREREVLSLLAQGRSNQEIADALVVTVETVKGHVSNLLAKLGADNRTQAVIRARALGLLSNGS